MAGAVSSFIAQVFRHQSWFSEGPQNKDTAGIQIKGTPAAAYTRTYLNTLDACISCAMDGIQEEVGEHKRQDIVQESGRDWEDPQEIRGGVRQHEDIPVTRLGDTAGNDE